MSKRGGLGRGLSALIPGAPEAGEASTGLLEVPANAIAPNPKQPRSRFDDETLEELAASIREVGILQPIVVRRTGQGYEVVTGERRLRAAKLAGLATVPVVLRDSDDSDLLREALIENIHREDLNPIELGEAFRQLLDELGTEAGGARRPGRRVAIPHRQHDPSARPALRGAAAPDRREDLGRPCAGPPRARRPEAITSLSLRVAAEDLSVRETEEIVRRFIEAPAEASPKKRAPRSEPTDPNLAEVEEILSEQLATRVVIRMGRRRGQVLIDFGSADDLERIVSEIVGSGPGLAPD